MTENGSDTILLLYWFPFDYAANVRQHALSFEEYSEFDVLRINVYANYPSLSHIDFNIIVLHYSMFGGQPVDRDLPRHFKSQIQSDTFEYVVAFFQDEYRYCPQRFELINELDVDHIYTLVDPDDVAALYGANTDVEEITYTLAGFVSPDLTTAAETWRKPDKDRSIDIGYRSRRLPYYLGDAGRHKSQIGIRFNEHLSNSDLSTDISVEYRDRLYGDDWWQFLGNCRACLGTEGGSSTFDLDGSLFEHHKEVMDSNPSISYDEYKEQVLSEYNRDIGYRTITPRHFEYASFRCCQILLEGEYSGVLEPDCHYIPVKRDYSNLKEALNKYRDPAVRSRLTENAYTDLIVSDEYTYKSFIQSFDEMLRQKGFQPGKSATLRDTRQTYKRSLRRQKQREWLESVISRAIGAVRRRGDRALQLLSR